MTQQDKDKKDLLTIEELAEHAMAEAAKEAEDRKGKAADDDEAADDALSADADGDANNAGDRNDATDDEDDKAEAEGEKAYTEGDNAEDSSDGKKSAKGRKSRKGKGKAEDNEKDSLKERLRQYVDDDDAPPPSFKISLKAIIGGDGLSKVVARNWVFILVIVFFTCCYVTSRYMMQGAAIEHTNLNKQLEDRKIKALTITSEYLEKTRKEYIKESLTDTTLHSTVEIPYSLPLN